MRRSGVFFACATAAVVLASASALAQNPPSADTRPAFSLATSQTFTTRERPAVYLTFRRLNHLDFRVYRVRDPMAFFAQLKDLHQLGGEEPTVPQERTWLERLADWKAARRQELRDFARGQFSFVYRRARTERLEARQVQLRRTVRYSTFAEVPLLNASQVVSSWREILPDRRDAESRRIPLDLQKPGLYLVEAVHAPLRAYTIVMISDVGLVAKTAPGQLLLFAANRFSGNPVPGCEVRAFANQKPVANGATRDDGTTAFDLGEAAPENLAAVARCGSEVAAIDPGGWFAREKSRELIGYVYTDKPIYRPGHIVRTKAILRWRGHGVLAPFDRREVEVVISDTNDKVIYRRNARVDEFGAVSASVPLGPAVALGYYSIQINSEDEHANGAFEVQEYRRPEFEVTVTPEQRFVVQGGQIEASVAARYYFGQNVTAAMMKYVVHRQEYYSPLRWQEDESFDGGWWYGGEQIAEGQARLGEDGKAAIAVPLDIHSDGRDYSLRIEARVTDASGREVSGSTIVHSTYGRFLLNTRLDGYVFQPGASTTLRIRAIDYEGAPQSGVPVNVWLERLTRRGWQQEPEAALVIESVVATDADGRADWSVALPREAGDYRFNASAPSGDRVVRSQTYAWIVGPRDVGAGSGEQFLELIADKSTYQPGDTARLIIRGADPTAPVLITKERQQVTYYRVEPGKGQSSLDVPLGEEDVGDTYVNIAFFKDDRLYRAERRLKVPATSRALTIAIEASQNVAKPREPATFALAVTDAHGKPVRAQLSVGVIDEAVYGVKADSTPDPLRSFYRLEYSRVGTRTSREYSFVGYSGNQQLLLTERRRPLTLGDFKADRPVQPQVRKEFPDAIFWMADLLTDQYGRAQVTLTYPDALTTWRLTARAITIDTLVGSAIARTTTTKDLILRMAPPRFLTESDELELPVIVHNYLSTEKSVSVSVNASRLAVTGTPPSSTMTIPPSGEARQDWRFKADQVGTASLTGRAETAGASDAVELPIPVQPFGLSRTRNESGSIAGAGERTLTLQIPEASNPSARTIEVTLAPSLAGSVLSALDFLTSYPYGCTEQILSSFVPNLAVTRALRQLQIAPPERLRSLDRQVSEGLTRLHDYQHDDGGWGWWKTDRNHPFLTAYAVYGFLQAREAGYRIDADRLRSGVRSLVAQYSTYPRAIPDLKAYIAYVLALANARGIRVEQAADAPAPSLNAIVEEVWSARDRMSAYGRAFLLLLLQAHGRAEQAEQAAKELLGQVRTKAPAAAGQDQPDLAWWESPQDPLLFDFSDTSVEATALVVQGLAARNPREPILEPAVRWLMLNRNYGTYWSSTKQTAMVLLGLLDYMKARGEQPTSSSVDVVVNGATVSTTNFSPAQFTSPDPVVVRAAGAAGSNSVKLVKRGGGALYWSATARYFSTEPLQRTGSRQLALVRRYFTLSPVQQRGRIVYRETPFNGPPALSELPPSLKLRRTAVALAEAGTVHPGDLLVVRLSAAGSNDWRYLMIEDPIPAGTEPIQNDELYQLEQERGRSPWYGSRREFRDNRVVFFQEAFEAGRYDYRYLLKVVTPGVFTALPGRISAMYVPESGASSDPLKMTVTHLAAVASTPPIR